MKTLNEVITALDGCFLKSRKEWCIENCPYLQNNEQMCRQDVLNDALHYLKILKVKSEKSPIEELSGYVSLDFHQLAEMIGEPVYVKDSGCKGHWEIVMGVRKTVDGEDVCFRGCDRWQRIGETVYRTKEGAKE